LNTLLTLFVSRPGSLITRDEIARALWEDDSSIDVTNGINTAIRRLRVQLDNGNGDSGYIATVVGAGYRFEAPVSIAPVEEAETLAASPAVEPKAAPAVNPAPHSNRRKFISLAACALLLLALGVAGWRHFFPQPKPVVVEGDHWPDNILRDMTQRTFDEPEDLLTLQALSPSGARLAYVDHAGLSVQLVADRSEHLVAIPPGFTVGSVSWFPDESSLLASGVAAQGAGSEAWKVSLNGDPPRRLLQDVSLSAVSPDGRHIAFRRASRPELWVSDASGQNQRKLVTAAPGDTFGCLLWSPKSDRVVVDHFRARTQSGESVNLADSPENQLKTKREWVYESYDAATGALTAASEDLQFDSAALLSDGRLIYPVNRLSKLSNIAVRPTDPRTGAVVGPQKFLAVIDWFWSVVVDATTNVTVSTDGRHLSAILYRPSTDVFTADVSYGSAASNPTLEHVSRLTDHTGSSYPSAWSPDGSEVLFDNGDLGLSVIAAKKLSGGKVDVLAHIDRDAMGQFTPDGKWILFMRFSGGRERLLSLERMPAKGGKPEQVFVPGEMTEFSCSRASTGICVIREAIENKALVYYLLDPLQGRGPELARTPMEPHVLGDWSVSADGMTVAMADHDPDHPGIQLIPLADPAARSQTAPPPQAEIRVDGFGRVLGASWSADGKGFFVEAATGSAYSLLYVGMKGRTTFLYQNDDPIWAIPSRDGKKIAFPRRTMNRNVWLRSTVDDILR
jgi:DNA-binding winged helix-turn-helix (wHTH) protein/Tol biopolymer transport system component